MRNHCQLVVSTSKIWWFLDETGKSSSKEKKLAVGHSVSQQGHKRDEFLNWNGTEWKGRAVQPQELYWNSPLLLISRRPARSIDCSPALWWWLTEASFGASLPVLFQWDLISGLDCFYLSLLPILVTLVVGGHGSCCILFQKLWRQVRPAAYSLWL